uniref:Uncharacterized protein n=1 Tax=Trichogramma kaykai TaxID=54128 RepID=A0ABD2WJ19_9HYME
MIQVKVPPQKKRKIEEDRTDENLNLDAFVCKMIANLRLKTSITGSDLGSVADHVVNLLTDVIENVHKKLENFFEKHQVGETDVNVESFLKQFVCDSKQFSYLKYMKNQISILKKNYKYIEPEEIFLGNRTLNRADKNDPDEPLTEPVHFHYVSLIETIKLVFSNEEILNFKNYEVPVPDDILTRFEDGEIFKEHPFFKKYKDAIPIVLYYDEFLPNNPVGTKTRNQKLGGFYVSFLNLPEHLRDYIGNVHTLAIAKEEDIKEFGVENCLKSFMLELMKLESDNGVSYIINGKKITLRGTLVSVCADTLAAHELFGFLGPSATYFCRQCEITKDQKEFFPLINAPLRNKDSHDLYVKLAENEGEESVKGVKKSCILNESKYFHCTNNFNFDIMHDVLEGQGQLDLKLVLGKLIENKNYELTLDYINTKIKSFDYGPIDIKNKPSPIIAYSSHEIKLQERAAQTWVLLRAFPFFVSGKVENDDPYLKHIINLNMINEIIFAPKVPISMLSYLQELIDKHIETFQKLFPGTNLKNKLMHMRHYADCIKKSGPLRHLACFKYEAKHNLFIRYGNLCRNYRNLTKIMTTIGQISQSSLWGTNSPIIRTKLNYNSYEEPTIEDENMMLKVIGPELIAKNLKIVENVNIYNSEDENDADDASHDKYDTNVDGKDKESHQEVLKDITDNNQSQKINKVPKRRQIRYEEQTSTSSSIGSRVKDVGKPVSTEKWVPIFAARMKCIVYRSGDTSKPKRKYIKKSKISISGDEINLSPDDIYRGQVYEMSALAGTQENKEKIARLMKETRTKRQENEKKLTAVKKLKEKYEKICKNMKEKCRMTLWSMAQRSNTQ